MYNYTSLSYSSIVIYQFLILYLKYLRFSCQFRDRAFVLYTRHNLNYMYNYASLSYNLSVSDFVYQGSSI
jgi:hypothetical protein